MGRTPSNGELVSQSMEGTERGTLSLLVQWWTVKLWSLNGGYNARQTGVLKCEASIMQSRPHSDDLEGQDGQSVSNANAPPTWRGSAHQARQWADSWVSSCSTTVVNQTWSDVHR